MPARNGTQAQPARPCTAAPVLCDITNTNSNRSGQNAAKKGKIDTSKTATFGNCPASGFAAGLAAAAGCLQPTQRAGCDTETFASGLFAAATGQARPMEVEPESVLNLNPLDPQSVSEYAMDIYSHFQRNEARFVPNADYMASQTDINKKMRSILIDWLVEVHLKYKMRTQTLFMAVNTIDRYLERKVVSRRQLQLVGVASMLIAAKYEEIYPPAIKEFVYITDNAYTKEDILSMEMNILTTLNFQLCGPTMADFLDQYQRANNCNEKHCHLMQYLVELALVDPNMMAFTPSQIVAAATLLSNKLLKWYPFWSPVMVEHTRMTESMVKACARELCNVLEAAETNQLQAVRRKYSQPKFSNVGKMSF